MSDLEEAPLGRKVSYSEHYDPGLLYAIERAKQRSGLAVEGTLPFSGSDYYTAYELSWLDLRGKPVVAIGVISVGCDSPYLIESKSLKLYFNSFNQTEFADKEVVIETMVKDLTGKFAAPVTVKLYSVDEFSHFQFKPLPGILLDDLAVDINTYEVSKNLLTTLDDSVEEELVSHLLKTNCLITGQPDWGSLYIHYAGPQIDHASMLRYIISYRKHIGFSELCVEQIFLDIMEVCQPEKLSVYASYTRRGGIDINPFRSNVTQHFNYPRLARQ